MEQTTDYDGIVVKLEPDEKAEDEHLVCTPDLVMHGNDAPDTPAAASPQPPEVAIDMCPQMMGCLGAIPTTKRKRNVLSLENKIEVIRRLESGENILTLSRIFNCGRATIFDIKSQKDSIMSFANGLRDETMLKTRKTMRIPRKRMKDMFKDSFVDQKLRASSGSADASTPDAAEAADFKESFEGSCLASPSCSNSGMETASTDNNSGGLKPSLGDSPSQSHDSQSSDSLQNKNDSNGRPEQSDIDTSTSQADPSFAPGLLQLTPYKQTTKRKHHVLSIETKIEILQRLDNGEKGNALAPLYNIGRATISDIRQKRDSILKFASKLKSEDGLRRRKTMRKAKDTALEDAVFMWYVQGANLGEDVTGPRICDKALELNAKLGGPPDFRASSGWLKNFRARHGIRGVQGERGNEVACSGAPALYLETFLNLLLQEGYHQDDIYSADEATVDWQAMPLHSAAYARPQVGLDGWHEPVTVLLCANSSWSHALPLLVVGRRKKREYFGHVPCFPVDYRRQRNGWMDTGVFMSWYANDFIPAVRKERELKRKQGRVVLLVDSAPCHPIVDMLNRVDENFRVMFLPSHFTAAGHPLMQATSVELKCLFKLGVLSRLMSAPDAKVVECAERLTLKECCHMLADVWSNLCSQNKKAAADKLWFLPESPPEVEESRLQEALGLFAQISGFEDCTLQDAFDWLNVDAQDPCNNVLTDDEIVAFVQAEESSEEEEEREAKEAKSAAKKAQPAVAPPPPVPAIAWRAERTPHAEAYRAFETVMGWCEQQVDTSSEELLLLKRLRDLAVKKLWAATCGLQSKITSTVG